MVLRFTTGITPWCKLAPPTVPVTICGNWMMQKALVRSRHNFVTHCSATCTSLFSYWQPIPSNRIHAIAAMSIRRLALTQNNLDWAATRLENQENIIVQLQTDLRRQQKILLDMLTRLQVLEQRLLYHGYKSKCPENTQDGNQPQTLIHLEELDE